MRKMNNKGFTLIELIAVIILLAIVAGIGSYSIIQIINNAKEKDYDLLVENIRNGVELYYQECKYANPNTSSSSQWLICPSFNSDSSSENYGYSDKISLNILINYGYLKGNGTKSDNTKTLVNPNTEVNITNCNIRYKYEDGKIVIKADGGSGMTEEQLKSCPTTDDYNR